MVINSRMGLECLGSESGWELLGQRVSGVERGAGVLPEIRNGRCPSYLFLRPAHSHDRGHVCFKHLNKFNFLLLFIVKLKSTTDGCDPRVG